MADIRTRDADRGMKFKDKVGCLPKELVRDLTLKAADTFRSGGSVNGFEGEAVSEDAGHRLERGMEWTVERGTRSAWDVGKKVAGKAAGKWRDRKADAFSEAGDSAEGRTAADKQGAPRSGTGKPSTRKGHKSSAALRETSPHERLPGSVEEPGIRKTGETAGCGRQSFEKHGKVWKDTAKEIKGSGKTARRTNDAKRIAKETVQAKIRSERAYQAGKRLAMQGKRAAKTGAKGTKKVFQGMKTAVRTAVTAVRAVIGLASVGASVVFLVVILGVIGGIAGISGSSSSETLSQEVLAYTATIRKYASEFGIPEYVASIQAIMMQESGGIGIDPMQASECPYNTEYPNTPGGITDPEYSIKVGIQYYADCVEQAGCAGPEDLGGLQLSWQGYNYGSGYIGWALTNYGGYSLENALEFSQQQAAAHGWSGYGDPEYVPHVQRYYSYGNLFAGLLGNRQIVSIALAEVGNTSGEKYWSWYGFSGEVEWCACFVSWCGDQAGLIESGTMPKFSLCADGVTWFRSQGKWQDPGSTPTAGWLIFFDWDGDGTSDHVGIVESCENGIVHTIEGNSSDMVKQNRYSVGSSSILGYGILP